jgi:hypothetical protein
VLVSGRAAGDLREARRRDGARFKIYLKKIRCVRRAVLRGIRRKAATGR